MVNSEHPLNRAALQGTLPASLSETLVNRLFLLVILLESAFLRLWQITALGYNTDEAVYSGTAAAIAGDPTLSQFFPIFRAHPLFSQFLLALMYGVGGVNDWAGRILAVAFGLLTIFFIYKVGTLLYSPRVGLIAALFVALMPLHVVVSRQFLLDGPMMAMATLTLYFLARFAKTERPVWLYATGVGMGLTFLAKETGIVMLAAIYTFLALSPDLRVRIRDIVISIVLMALTIAPFPVSLLLGQTAGTGQNYLVWQLFRRPNHDWDFYLTTQAGAIGPLVLLAAVVGLLWIVKTRQWSWRERLLVLWTLVPVLFFQMWPVKGYQYLMPIVAPLTVLAGSALSGWRSANQDNATGRVTPAGIARAGIIAAISITLLLSTWTQIQSAISDRSTAGAGGIPGGREAGLWVKENVPQEATMMALGPSMANILQFYGHRQVLGLSVSPNPLHRNPSYDPINNPDLRLRNGDIQYIVWDSFSAARSQFFADKLMQYVNKYNGRIVHTQQVTVPTAAGQTTQKPIIIIYEVRP